MVSPVVGSAMAGWTGIRSLGRTERKGARRCPSVFPLDAATSVFASRAFLPAFIVALVARSPELVTWLPLVPDTPVVIAGTGAVLKLAERGDVDVVLVHERAAEDAFVTSGHGIDRRDVMHNDFVLVGPADDPAGIAGFELAADALAQGELAAPVAGQPVS